MITFRVAHNLIRSRPTEVVEIIENVGSEQRVIGCLYAHGELSVMLVSAHLAGFAHNDGRGTLPPFPSYTFTFDPQPYVVSMNQLIRMNANGVVS